MLLPQRGGIPMVRFSYYRSDEGEHWILFGRLSGLWVDDLRSVWRRIRQHAPRRQAVVDCNEVTFIDEAGEQLLAEMQRSGAEFVATEVGIKHSLANLGDGVATVGRAVEYLDGGRS
jgi:ABC-type transporter Mla MlaB component